MSTKRSQTKVSPQRIPSRNIPLRNISISTACSSSTRSLRSDSMCSSGGSTISDVENMEYEYFIQYIDDSIDISSLTHDNNINIIMLSNINSVNFLVDVFYTLYNSCEDMEYDEYFEYICDKMYYITYDIQNYLYLINKEKTQLIKYQNFLMSDFYEKYKLTNSIYSIIKLMNSYNNYTPLYDKSLENTQIALNTLIYHNNKLHKFVTSYCDISNKFIEMLNDVTAVKKLHMNYSPKKFDESTLIFSMDTIF